MPDEPLTDEQRDYYAKRARADFAASSERYHRRINKRFDLWLERELGVKQDDLEPSEYELRLRIWRAAYSEGRVDTAM